MDDNDSYGRDRFVRYSSENEEADDTEGNNINDSEDSGITESASLLQNKFVPTKS